MQTGAEFQEASVHFEDRESPVGFLAGKKKGHMAPFWSVLPSVGTLPELGQAAAPSNLADKETRTREAANIPLPTVCGVNPGRPWLEPCPPPTRHRALRGAR